MAFMIASNSAMVAGPMMAASSIILAGVQAAYRRWALGMCSVIVVWRCFTAENTCAAMRSLLWKISTVVPVMRASRPARLRHDDDLANQL